MNGVNKLHAATIPAHTFYNPTHRDRATMNGAPGSVLKYEKTLSKVQEVTARSDRVIAIEGGDEISRLVEHTTVE